MFVRAVFKSFVIRISLFECILSSSAKLFGQHRSGHRRCHIKSSALRNLNACNFIKKETLVQLFSCEFCEIFKNTFFTEHLRTTASVRREFVLNVMRHFVIAVGLYLGSCQTSMMELFFWNIYLLKAFNYILQELSFIDFWQGSKYASRQYPFIHCVKSVRMRSYSGPYAVRMRENMD